MAIAPTVRDPPKSATRPRVIEPAATATAKGSSLRGRGRMRRRVSAITRPATPSSSSVWLRSSRAPASTTTGAPVTM